MQLISARLSKPDFILEASQKAKFLSSPVLFLAKALAA